MSDLISRGVLIKALETAKETCKGLHEYVFFDAVLAMVDAQPTAYDADKVVEQLEEARDELLHSTDYNNDIINYCLDWFDMAIEIVKGAVKDE